jgi:hypothetical protein
MTKFCGMCDSEGRGHIKADGIAALTSAVAEGITNTPAIGAARFGAPLPSVTDIVRSSVPDNGQSTGIGKFT